MQAYRNPEIDPQWLADKRVAILGYGNQGRPQAANLRDSAVQVAVGLRETSGKWAEAQAENLNPMPFGEAIQWADVVMLLLPDHVMGHVYTESIAPHLRPGQYLGFCHGFAIHYGQIQPPKDVNVFLMAPKAQGLGVRNRYLSGSGALGLTAVHQDPSGDTLQVALGYGRAIGCGRIGILPTTFREETECNLFSEQVVLVGGLTSLIATAWETLVEAGYGEEEAWIACLYEVKLLSDLIHEKGITGMREAISPTARYGDVTRGCRVIDGHVKESMRKILGEIQSGSFASEFMADAETGGMRLDELVLESSMHPIEKAHAGMRGLLK